MLVEVNRLPDLDGQQVHFVYLRELDEEGVEVARHPQAYRVLPDGPWVTAPALVVPITEALFARDAIYARVMQAIAPTLALAPDEDGNPRQRPTRRLDVGDKVVVGVSAEGVTEAEMIEAGGAFADALSASCADLLASDRVAIVWAD